MRFLTDTFTDANNTLLESHAGEFGSWSAHSGVVGDYSLAIVGNALSLPPDSTSSSATITKFYYGGDPTGNEYDVRGSFIVPSGTLSHGIALAGRVNTSVVTWYAVELTITTVSSENRASITLYKKISGVRTNLVTYTVPTTLSAGDGHILMLRLWNKNKSVFFNGLEVIKSTDNTITGVGAVGVQGLGSVLPLSEIYADWYENAALNDTFTDTDGVLVGNHLSDSGHTWIDEIGLSIKSNAAIGYDGRAFSSLVPPGSEYDVNIVVVPLLSGSVGEKVSALARYVNDAYEGYYEMEILNGVTECPVYTPPPPTVPECPTPPAPVPPPVPPPAPTDPVVPPTIPDCSLLPKIKDFVGTVDVNRVVDGKVVRYTCERYSVKVARLNPSSNLCEYGFEAFTEENCVLKGIATPSPS